MLTRIVDIPGHGGSLPLAPPSEARMMGHGREER